jgi:hypothetical protein
MRALVLLQPAFYVLMFVRRVVIADDVDLLVARHCTVDHAWPHGRLLKAHAIAALAFDGPLRSIQWAELHAHRVSLRNMTLDR